MAPDMKTFVHRNQSVQAIGGTPYVKAKSRQETANQARLSVKSWSISKEEGSVAVEPKPYQNSGAKTNQHKFDADSPNHDTFGSEYTESTIGVSEPTFCDDQLQPELQLRGFAHLQHHESQTGDDRVRRRIAQADHENDGDEFGNFNEENQHSGDSRVGEHGPVIEIADEMFADEVIAMSRGRANHDQVGSIINLGEHTVFSDTRSYPTTTSGGFPADSEDEIHSRSKQSDLFSGRLPLSLLEADPHGSQNTPMQHYRQHHARELAIDGRVCLERHQGVADPAASRDTPPESILPEELSTVKNDERISFLPNVLVRRHGDSSMPRPRIWQSATNEVSPQLTGNLLTQLSHIPEPHDKIDCAMLDYDESLLYKMDYDMLLGQSFDEDPGLDGQILPDEWDQKNLPDRLSHVRNLNSQEQARFFASLTLADWEESSDWFQEQFAKIFARMKQSRRKRRDATKEFEDEIFLQHEAVSKERQGLKEAFDKMKANGGLVLGESTAKRKRP